MITIGTLILMGAATPFTINGDESKALQTIQKTPLDVLTENPNRENIKQAIVFVAKNKDINQTHFVALAQCESGLKDICIIDTNNKASCGIFMFQKTTFLQYCPDLQWHNSIKDDILCAGRMVKDGLMKIHWVQCSKKIL